MITTDNYEIKKFAIENYLENEDIETILRIIFWRGIDIAGERNIWQMNGKDDPVIGRSEIPVEADNGQFLATEARLAAELIRSNRMAIEDGRPMALVFVVVRLLHRAAAFFFVI